MCALDFIWQKNILKSLKDFLFVEKDIYLFNISNHQYLIKLEQCKRHIPHFQVPG